MDLVTLREQFAKESGRLDLIVDTTDWADDGANYYIQRGSRFLDRLVTTSFSKAKHYESAAADTWYKVFQECRAILEVWAANDEFRKKLELRDATTFREYYNEPAGSIDSGAPTYYMPALLRTHPQTSTMYLERFVDTDYTETSKYDYEYNGVMWMPPTDEAIILEVQGLWYSYNMTLDADSNYWSVNHPEALIAAARYMIEVTNRNTEGMKDWLRAITELTTGVEKDTVEEESYNVVAIRG